MRHFASAMVVLLMGSVVARAAPDFDDAAPGIIHPDGAPSEAPSGPEGPLVDPGAPIAGRPSAAAPQPGPPPSAAARRKAHLDSLFERLAKAQDQAEATTISGMIAQAMILSGSDTADLLMQRVLTAMQASDNVTAIALLDKLIVLRPNWAEAWNKRATVRYLDNDDSGSMADIGRVLALEPRHFGALSGMGLILHRNGQDKSALRVFRSAAAINPQDPGVKLLIEQIVPAVEGSDL